MVILQPEFIPFARNAWDAIEQSTANRDICSEFFESIHKRLLSCGGWNMAVRLPSPVRVVENAMAMPSNLAIFPSPPPVSLPPHGAAIIHPTPGQHIVRGMGF